MNTTFHNPDRIFKYLSKIANDQNSGMTQSQINAILRGQVELNDKVLYVKDDISAKSGIHKLIETSDSKAVGTTNIDKAQLPERNFFFIEAIRIAAGVSSNDPDGETAYSTDRTLWDKALYNAHFRISQRGKTLLELPMNIFTGDDLPSGRGLAGDEAYVLKQMKHLVPQQEIGLEIEFAGSVTGNEVIEVSLIGRQTEVRV